MDSIVTEVAKIVKEPFAEGDASPALGRMSVEHATEYGVVGDERSERKIREKIRKHVWHEL